MTSRRTNDCRLPRLALLAAVSVLSVSSAIGCGGASAARYAAEMASAPAPDGWSQEEYTDYGVNRAVDPAEDSVATFSVDVDTASYAIARRKLVEGALPPREAVRVEEFLNYFDYTYPSPNDATFAVHTAAAPNPFEAGHHVLRVGIQGRRIAPAERKPVHLVYLVDTSGSMQSEDKIGLVQHSLKLLTNTLQQGDTIALCTYAGDVREVLAPTGIEDKGRILAAIDDLSASGSTAMASGLDLAYELARRTMVKGHESRVIVLSDGDANVGDSTHEAILERIRRHREAGVTLSTVGFGMGNYKDTMMEQLADQGDGNYAYIDSPEQARRVFSEQSGAMLQVIARDVKVQVEFDPKVVASYRLVGYENRDLADQDFRNDRVDAGEVGAGHAVTALFDVVLKSTDAPPVVVRLRHKDAESGAGPATEDAFPMVTSSIATSFDEAPPSLRFATAVMAFAEKLRESPFTAQLRYDDIERIASRATEDRGDRKELVSLVRTAAALAGERKAQAVAN